MRLIKGFFALQGGLRHKGSTLCVILILGIAGLEGRSIGYDAAGRVVWTIQPNGQTTTFSYDGNGNLEAIGSVVPGADADLDGIPDYFELRFSGSTTGLDSTADEDSDQNNNFVEYAFARSPDKADGYALTVISLTEPDPATGEEFHILRYLRPQSGPLHLEYNTEISFDLIETWLTGLPDVIETVATPREGGIEEVTVRFLAPSGSVDRFFMRLSVKQR
ncbi:MAG: hypothetical protein GVY36_20090 [Verrucomicrobia bacterium]|jgi:YD repeat-containing protein|nr:hypothetical protein [Verrucomicrobiota bacterium]